MRNAHSLVFIVFAVACSSKSPRNDTPGPDDDGPGDINVAPVLDVYDRALACTAVGDVDRVFTATDDPAQTLTFTVTGGSCPPTVAFVGNTLVGDCPLTGVACTIAFEVSDGLSATAGSVEVAPTARFVALDATGAANGTSWADAFTTLGAITAGELPVMVQEGVYEGSDEPLITAGGVYYGGFDGTETTFDARGELPTTLARGSVQVQLENATAVLDRFEFREVFRGVAVRATNVTLTLRDSIFSGNIAIENGGALSFVGGALTVENVVFENHTLRSDGAASGAAIYARDAVVTIERSVFRSNVAYAEHGSLGLAGFDASGGALYVSGGSLTVRATEFDDNVVYAGDGGAGAPGQPQAGGALGGPGGAGGRAHGGAIAALDLTSSTIEDCTFHDNASASGSGGTGGPAALNTTTNGPGVVGGAGGSGGDALGGAIFIAGAGVTHWRGTSFTGNFVLGASGGTGGQGGSGGAGNSDGGPGGGGGNGSHAQGAAAFVDGTSLTTESCSLSGNYATTGDGGSGGAGGSRTGTGVPGLPGLAGLDTPEGCMGIATRRDATLTCIENDG